MLAMQLASAALSGGWAGSAPTPALRRLEWRRRRDGRWRLLFALAVAVALFASGVRVVLSDFPDDAWITFAYAHHLAEGNGFVFSARYPTWGTTTPLFALILALPAALGIPLPFAARVLDFGALVAQAAALLVLLKQAGCARWSPLMLVLWSTLWWLPSSFPGMEYGLHGALALVALAAIATDRWRLAALAGGLAPVLRPDGFFLLLLVAAAYLWHTRLSGEWKIVGALLVIPGLLWYTFALLQFGSPMPRTLAMRQVEAMGWGGFFTFWRRYQFSPSQLNFFILPGVLAAPLVLWRAPRLCWAAAWFGGYILLYTVMGLPGLPQYLAPLNAMAIAANVAGVAALWRWRATRGIAGRVAAILFAVACMWSIAFLSHYIWRLEFRTHEMPAKYQAYEAIGRYLNEVFDPRTVYACNEIGYLGFHLPHDLVELGGLVNPEGLNKAATGRLADLLESEPISVLILPRQMEPIYRPDAASYAARMFRLVGDIPTWDYGPVAVYVRHDLFTPLELEDQRDLLRSHARNVWQGLDVHRGPGTLLPGPRPELPQLPPPPPPPPVVSIDAFEPPAEVLPDPTP